ncbi:hypothetical protein [Sphingomonas sp. LM7]|uniref:hypothetical protein n=1 Tax=Sphingomonas sp. LM7 TaxID=1938607 RepID=UPI000983BA23|nr:hypothetical protein [Sphingomonas sp. LM7]AQR72739.1 hypothetical protein BXU08_02800 [Sphingomonas sp. LM7]
MSDPQDVSGVWYGRYAADHGYEDNGFIALLEELHGAVTGTISEPDEDSGSVRRATVRGQRDGASLHFTKQYDGSGGWIHSVDYNGHVDADGTLVMGGWIVEGLTGAFDMTREKFDAEALEAEEDVEIVIGRRV